MRYLFFFSSLLSRAIGTDCIGPRTVKMGGDGSLFPFDPPLHFGASSAAPQTCTLPPNNTLFNQYHPLLPFLLGVYFGIACLWAGMGIPYASSSCFNYFSIPLLAPSSPLDFRRPLTYLRHPRFYSVEPLFLASASFSEAHNRGPIFDLPPSRFSNSFSFRF